MARQLQPVDGRGGTLHPAWYVVLAAAGLAVAIDLVVELSIGRWPMMDLDIYRWGGERARQGLAVYDGVYASSPSPGYRFTYPPAAAVAFAPLSLLPFGALRALVAATCVGGLLVTAWAALGSLRWPRGEARAALAAGLTCVALLLAPVRETLFFGQINIILMALVVVDLCLPDTSRWKGVGVGIATGVKLTAAIFIPYLLLTRRWAAAGRATAVAVATAAAGFVALPDDSWRFWADGLFADAARVGDVASVSNQSLHGVAVRALGGLDQARPLWWLAALAIGVGGLVVAAAWSRRGAELAGILTCALTGLLVSPVSWSHHWVWALPALALAADGALRGSRAAWVAATAAVVVLWARPGYRGHIWQVPNWADAEHDWTPAQALVGNLYVLAGLVALAVAAALLARPGLRPGSDPGRRPR